MSADATPVFGYFLHRFELWFTMGFEILSGGETSSSGKKSCFGFCRHVVNRRKNPILVFVENMEWHVFLFRALTLKHTNLGFSIDHRRSHTTHRSGFFIEVWYRILWKPWIFKMVQNFASPLQGPLSFREASFGTCLRNVCSASGKRLSDYTVSSGVMHTRKREKG